MQSQVSNPVVRGEEQVESLGGKFLTVEGSENLETEGGYAKEASEDFKKKQEELLSETLRKIDIVICTALIPGKKAPLIIKDNMVENLAWIPGLVLLLTVTYQSLEKYCENKY